jgi:hypothetical protein
MSDSTPSRDEVRMNYAYLGGQSREHEYDERCERFDRWLSDELAKAWDEGFGAGFDHGADDIGGWEQAVAYDETGDAPPNPYRVVSE